MGINLSIGLPVSNTLIAFRFVTTSDRDNSLVFVIFSLIHLVEIILLSFPVGKSCTISLPMSIVQ